MRILVFELSPKGHRLAWVRHLLPYLRQAVDSVVLVTSVEAQKSPEYAAFIPQASAGVEVQIGARQAYTADAGPELMWNGLRSWRRLLAAIRKLRPDRVIVPSGDGLIHTAGLTPAGILYSGPPLEAGLIKCTFAYRDRSPGSMFRTGLTLAGLWRTPFSSIKIINPLAMSWLREHAPRTATRFELVPDPVEEPPRILAAEARGRLGIEAGVRVVGALGTLNARKGIDRLVRAFVRMRPGPQDRLLLAGRLTKEVRVALAEVPADLAARIIVVDRYLDTESYWVALSAMDVVAAPYVNHRGSSGMLIAAAKLQKPVLGCAYGWIEHVIDSFSLGWVCPVDDQAGFSAALRTALDKAPAYQPGESARRFAAYHSVDGFCAAWAGEAIAGSSPPGWDWVLGSGGKRAS